MIWLCDRRVVLILNHEWTRDGLTGLSHWSIAAPTRKARSDAELVFIQNLAGSPDLAIAKNRFGTAGLIPDWLMAELQDQFPWAELIRIPERRPSWHLRLTDADLVMLTLLDDDDR